MQPLQSTKKDGKIRKRCYFVNLILCNRQKNRDFIFSKNRRSAGEKTVFALPAGAAGAIQTEKSGVGEEPWYVMCVRWDFME